MGFLAPVRIACLEIEGEPLIRAYDAQHLRISQVGICSGIPLLITRGQKAPEAAGKLRAQVKLALPVP